MYACCNSSNNLTHLSSAVSDYIEETRSSTGDLEQRVSTTKDNVDTMNNIMTKWCDSPLYERKEKRGLLNLDVSKRASFILNSIFSKYQPENYRY